MIVVVGTSAGGLAALRALLRGIPEDFAAPICIVQHIGRYPSRASELLQPWSALPIRMVSAPMPLEPGKVYFAAPDQHLLIAAGHAVPERGPRENFARPAIDPLFRSAAEEFGPATIGVILTGRLNDGTAGLYELKKRGGTAIVQDPRSAEYSDMPQSAATHVDIDHCVPLEDIPALLSRLVAAQPYTESAESAPSVEETSMKTSSRIKSPNALTCPECGGSMRSSTIGSLIEFDCHTGHRFTSDVVADAQLAGLEQATEMLVRRLNERAKLCRLLAERARESGDRATESTWSAAARDALDRIAPLRTLMIAPMQPADAVAAQAAKRARVVAQKDARGTETRSRNAEDASRFARRQRKSSSR